MSGSETVDFLSVKNVKKFRNRSILVVRPYAVFPCPSWNMGTRVVPFIFFAASLLRTRIVRVQQIKWFMKA